MTQGLSTWAWTDWLSDKLVTLLVAKGQTEHYSERWKEFAGIVPAVVRARQNKDVFNSEKEDEMKRHKQPEKDGSL